VEVVNNKYYYKNWRIVEVIEIKEPVELKMNDLFELPKDLIGEITSYLDIKFIARLAATCRIVNDQIWYYVHRLTIYEEAYTKHFQLKPLNVQRLINLQGLYIPRIDTQLLHLSHLTRLIFTYGGSSDELDIVKQLTQLHDLRMFSNTSTVDEWRNTLNAEHSRLTQIRVRFFNFSPDMLNLPIMTRLKSLSIGVVSQSQVEEEDLAPLFDLTTLRELELSGMKINTTHISGFSRLCSIRSISLSVVYSTLTEDENRINFEEFQTLKYLTSLKVSGLAHRKRFWTYRKIDFAYIFGYI
jgi:hypothetical protein